MKPGTFTQMYVQLVFAVKNRGAAYNLYEVCCRMYNCFYNTWSPTGYSYLINIEIKRITSNLPSEIMNSP